MSKNIKKRNWAFILYPESAPFNWRDMLQETGCQFAISPLHDKDINADNTEKKPHYHIIVCYDGPTSYNVICRITEMVNATIPQPLEQIRGYYRYFTHLDNPEKYQYNQEDISTINGFDINNYIEMTYTEVSQIIISLQHLIRDNNITEYSDLLDMLLDNDLREMWDVARNHTFLLDKYITSRRHKTISEAEQKNVSRETDDY